MLSIISADGLQAMKGHIFGDAFGLFCSAYLAFVTVGRGTRRRETKVGRKCEIFNPPRFSVRVFYSLASFYAKVYSLWAARFS